MSLDTTARGGGYYVVYSSPIKIPLDVIDGPAWLRQNALRLTQHTQEREAMVKCSQILEAVKNGAPVVYPYYTHELCVLVVETVVQENVGVLPPPVIPETIPEGEALDLLNLIDSLLPESGEPNIIQASTFWGGVEIFMDQCKTHWKVHRYRMFKDLGADGVPDSSDPRDWIGLGWRGGIILWHEMNVRFLVKSVGTAALLLSLIG